MSYRYPFINRTKDFHRLKSSIENVENSNKIIFLHSKTGVGKSRFVREFFIRHSTCFNNIKISTLNSQHITIDSLFFFNRMYEELYQYFENSHKIKQKYSINGIGLGFAFFSGSISITNSGKYSSETIKRFNYLLKVLSKKNSNIIINIENIHLIDAESFRLLSLLMSQTEGNTYLLEYTISDLADQSDLLRMVSSLEAVNGRNIVSIYEIEKLDFKEVIKIIEINDFDMTYLKNVYDSSEGNLTHICLLPNIRDELNKHKYKNIKEYNVINHQIDSLESRERLIIYVICHSKGIVSMDELHAILVQGKADYKLSNFFIDQTIDKFNKLGLINHVDNNVVIAHDSILENVHQLCKDQMYYISYKLSEQYFYTTMLDSERGLSILIYMYCIMGDHKILAIIPKIKDLLIYKNPKDISRYLCSIHRHLDTKKLSYMQKDYIYREFLEIAIVNGLIEEASLYYEMITDKSSARIKMLYGYLLGIRHSKGDLELLNHLIKATPDNTELCLILKIQKLMIFMETKDSMTTISYINSLLKEDEYKNYWEYMYILKNSAEYLNNKDAIKRLSHCIEYFTSKDMSILVSQCTIDLASRYAYDNNLSEAKRLLGSLNKDSLKLEYLLNNIAAIELLQNNLSSETEKKLNEALILCCNDYERLIILSNLLIYYCLINSPIEACDIANELKAKFDIISYQYEEIIHIILTNLRFYSIYCGNSEDINYYEMCLKHMLDDNIQDDLKDYTNSILNKSEIKDNFHQWYYYSRLNYRPEFLGYWSFNIPNDIQLSNISS